MKGSNSKALINPLSDISVVYGVVKLIRQNRKEQCTRNKTVFALIDRILSTTMETMHLWKGMLSAKACQRISDRSIEFQKIHHVSDMPPYVQTSFCLAILDARLYRKHPSKVGRFMHAAVQRRALRTCIVTVQSLHNYFDRNGNKPIGYYNKAVIAAEAWGVSEPS